MTRARGIVWLWPAAFVGAVYAIPGAAAMPIAVKTGLALGFGVLPAAIVGIAPRRRDRWRLILLGVLTGVPLAIGSVLSGWPVVAVVAIPLLAIGAAQLSTRRPVGRVALSISVPLVGVGLSYTDRAEGLALAALIVLGSFFAALVSLLWPEHDAPESVRVVAPTESMVWFGVRLGLAGATAAALGFAFDFDHVGWAAAAMLVMRPSIEMQELRSWGRVASVIVGGLGAAALAHVTDAPGWYALALVVVLAGAAATHTSRWYVTPTFTTFLAISLLVYADAATAQSRFNERVGETMLGIALAYTFGLLIPMVLARWRGRATLHT